MTTVGDRGNGTLTLQGGATANLTDVTIGAAAGSSGDIVLTGAGTTLNVSDSIILGGGGAGVLSLGAGTTLNIANLNIGPGGILTSLSSKAVGESQISTYTPRVGPT